MPVPFQLQYRIHHVFQYFWAGKGAFLRDMTNQEYRSAGFFGIS